MRDRHPHTNFLQIRDSGAADADLSPGSFKNNQAQYENKTAVPESIIFQKVYYHSKVVLWKKYNFTF